MKGWLLDTNVVASLFSATGAPSVKAWARAIEERHLFISVLTLAEYDKGIANLADDDPNRLRYSVARDALEARFADRVIPLDNHAVHRWGEISGRVRRDIGHPPHVIDTLMAATAIGANLYLASRNVKDLKHSGASVFNPWDDDIALFPVSLPRKRPMDL